MEEFGFSSIEVSFMEKLFIFKKGGLSSCNPINPGPSITFPSTVLLCNKLIFIVKFTTGTYTAWQLIDYIRFQPLRNYHRRYRNTTAP